MKLYKNLPGYDLESRADRAMNRAADWFFRDMRNAYTVIAALLVCVAVIQICWHWSVK